MQIGTVRSNNSSSQPPSGVLQLVNVPDELQNGKLFVCWCEISRNGNLAKVPVNPRTGNAAEADDPRDMEHARGGHRIPAEAPERGARGRPYVYPADGIMGVNFDDLDYDQGNIIPSHLAAEWLPLLDSYCEISPSSRGVKVWFKARLDLDGKTGRRDAKQGVEIYRERRFFTITGRRLSQFSVEVEVRQTVIEAFYSAIFSAKKTVIPALHTPPSLTDQEVIRRASEAENGTKFRALWTGHVSISGSQSEADAALCSILRFWTGDRETVRRLFSQSALGQREKWTARPDYQQSTLDLAGQGEVFSRSDGTSPLRFVTRCRLRSTTRALKYACPATTGFCRKPPPHSVNISRTNRCLSATGRLSYLRATSCDPSVPKPSGHWLKSTLFVTGSAHSTTRVMR